MSTAKRLTEAQFDALMDVLRLLADMPAPKRTPKHLTEDEFAERIGVAVITVRRWRKQGRGPKFLKADDTPGSTAPVRYRIADIEAWEQSCLVTPGAA